MTHAESWNNFYELAKKYYNHHKNLNIPGGFRTKDGFSYDKDGAKLGYWIYNQIKAYKNKTLSNDRIKKLLNIKINFESNRHELNWLDIYELLKKYKEHYKDLKVPENFKTKNGVDYDKNGTNIYMWLTTQKTLYLNGKLSEDKQNLLIELGIELITRKEKWERNYNLCKAYYEKYGHLNVSRTFKTKNGVDYDEKGIHIKYWIISQKVCYEKGTLDPENYNKLNLIGMPWPILKLHSSKIEEICLINNIDIELNKDILEHVTLYELSAKINYLISNSLPLTVNGKLHKIFSMCSINIQLEYGISLEEMINKYYQKEEKLLKKAS